MKKYKKNIIDFLLDKKICFAVIISYSYIFRPTDETIKEYTIIIREDEFGDRNKMKNKGFVIDNDEHTIHKNKHYIFGRLLNADEVATFRKKLSDNVFVLAKQTQSGEAYEIKNNSFKTYLDHTLPPARPDLRKFKPVRLFKTNPTL